MQRCLFAAGLLNLLVGLSSPAGAQDELEFRPRVVVRRKFSAIKSPPTMSAELAKSKIDDAELVLGVQVGKVARAYPINMLTGPSREIINDELGGQAIAATW